VNAGHRSVPPHGCSPALQDYIYIYIQGIWQTILAKATMQSPGEQVGLESLADAGERLCHPDVSRELISPVGTWQSDICLFRAMFARLTIDRDVILSLYIAVLHTSSRLSINSISWCLRTKCVFLSRLVRFEPLSNSLPEFDLFLSARYQTNDWTSCVRALQHKTTGIST